MERTLNMALRFVPATNQAPRMANIPASSSRRDRLQIGLAPALPRREGATRDCFDCLPTSGYECWMLTAGVIVAAGRGRRLGREIPKQYLPLGEVCALRRCVDLFLGSMLIDVLQVVIHEDDRDLHDEALFGLCDARLLVPVAGGDTRAASVRSGLEALFPRRPERVLIHDAARPFVPSGVIRAVIDALDEVPGAFAAVPVVDALWMAADNRAQDSVPRDKLWRAQTPQGFHYDCILAAHRLCTGDAADDVAVARAAGIEVRIVLGSEANFKITTEADLARARAHVESSPSVGERQPIELVATRA